MDASASSSRRLFVLFIAASCTVTCTRKGSTGSKPMRTIASTPALIAEGQRLFAACIGCHGAAGVGRVGIGPRLASKTFLAAASDEMLIRTISNGRPGTTMVGWGTQYKPAQIRALVAYLRWLNPIKPVSLNEAPLAGRAESGAQIFGSICAGCHGKNGAGYQETANGSGIGRQAFLSNASNGFLRHIIRHGKSGTPMRGFAEESTVAVANLTTQQIEDVIAHLRKQAW